MMHYWQQKLAVLGFSFVSLATWAAAPNGYRMLEGKGYTICEQMLKRMNAELASKPKGPVCGYEVLQSIPGVTPPPWVKLDLDEHKAMYKRFRLARQLRDEDLPMAFSEPQPKAGQQLFFRRMPSDEQLEEWDPAVKKNSQFYKWVGAWPAPGDTDVMLIEILQPGGAWCPVFSQKLFQPDLKKPVLNWSTSSNMPFIFGGRNYQFNEEMTPYADGHSEPISYDLSIRLIRNEDRRNPWPPDICHIRRKIYSSK